MADSIFDLPESRDGKLENLGIPSNKTRNNQTTATDFDVYYDMSKAMYTSGAVNKAFAYRAQRDSFEFQNMFSNLAQSMVADKMMISLANNEKIEEVIAKAHDKNADLMICGKLGIQPPKIIIACDNMNSTTGTLVQFCTPDGRNYMTFAREYHGGVVKTVAKELYIDGKYILNFAETLRNCYVIKDILENMVRHDDIFDINDNISKDHIDYIMNLPGTRLDKHIKNDPIHVTLQEKIIWSEKYKKPDNGIPEEDLNMNLRDKINIAYDHTSNSRIHVSEDDRQYWNNKFEMPEMGLEHYHLSLNLQNKINNMVYWDQIIDVDQGKIKENLLPDMSVDIDLDRYLEKERYETFLLKEWQPHSHAANTRHILDGERDVWNSKYRKPAGGIPETDLESILANKINGAVQSDYLFDYRNNGDIKVKDKFLPDELMAIKNHIANTDIHLTKEEKTNIQYIGNPLELNTLAKTLVSAINELNNRLQKLEEANNSTHIITK